MSADQPLVSYLVPCFNHQTFVRQTIQSILAQDYPHVEIIACDDCSRDGTYEVLKEFISIDRVRIHKNETNLGVSKTLNKMVSLARGEFLGFIGSDDWMATNKTSLQVRYLQKSGKDCAMGPIFKYTEETRTSALCDLTHLTRVFEENRYLHHLYQTDSDGALLQSGLFRTEGVKTINGFLEHYKSDDWLFMIRWLQAGLSVGFLNEPFVHYRIHNTNTYTNVEKCLYELEFPVINDFIPPSFRPEITSNVLHGAALKCLPLSKLKALKYFSMSLRAKPSFRRLNDFLKSFFLSFKFISKMNKALRH